MASSGVINGTDILLYVDGTAISYSTSANINITGPGGAPVNHKDSGNWTTKLKKKGIEWTASMDGMFALDGTDLNIRELYDVLNGLVEVTIKMGTSDVTDAFFSGAAVCTGFNVDAPLDEGGTFSAEFEGLGKLSFSLT